MFPLNVFMVNNKNYSCIVALTEYKFSYCWTKKCQIVLKRLLNMTLD